MGGFLEIYKFFTRAATRGGTYKIGRELSPQISYCFPSISRVKIGRDILQQISCLGPVSLSNLSILSPINLSFY